MDQTVPASAARRPGRRPSPLALIVAAATAGLGLALVIPMVVLGVGLDPMFSAMVGGCLGIAALIALGLRWTPALALLPGLGLPAMLVPFLLTNLGSPLFLAGLLLLGCGVIAVLGALPPRCRTISGPPASGRCRAGLWPSPPWCWGRLEVRKPWPARPSLPRPPV